MLNFYIILNLLKGDLFDELLDKKGRNEGWDEIVVVMVLEGNKEIIVFKYYSFR